MQKEKINKKNSKWKKKHHLKHCELYCYKDVEIKQETRNPQIAYREKIAWKHIYAYNEEEPSK